MIESHFSDEPADTVRSGVREVLPAEGRYRPGDMLGQGGMGEVRCCDDVREQRTVAQKILRHDVHDAGMVSRFLDEARMQAALEHPAVVPVYDVGVGENGAPFFTMKRIEGVTLSDVLEARRDGAPTVSGFRLWSALVDVCLAIDFAHAHGIAHGDLKPDNVMLGRFGEVHLLDWGCAVRIDPDGASPTLPMRRTLEIAGTPGYLAPEQARGVRGDPRSDVYAFGAILFELLTGERLHSGHTVLARVVASLDRPTQRPSERAPGRRIHPVLDDLVVAMLAGDPAERPTAREVAERLEAHFDPEARLVEPERAAPASPLVTAAPPAALPFRWGAWAALATVVAALAAVGTVVW